MDEANETRCSGSGSGSGSGERIHGASNDEVDPTDTIDFEDGEFGWLLAETRARLFDKPSEPNKIGRYRVIRRIGAGGMGTVYEAFDDALGRAVAVKVLRRALGARNSQRLFREARALAQLSHPNVVHVYEVGESEGQSFVAMELVPGQTLRKWCEQEPRPSWRACLEVFLAAAAGLAAAHRQGLVHRDFKPSNVIVDDEGRVRVLDFGLARAVDPSSSGSTTVGRTYQDTSEKRPGDSSSASMEARLTETGCVMGTAAYMSLEQMRGQMVDARSDQFSFCVSLYEAVYGERPFKGRSVLELEQAIPLGLPRKAPPRSRAIPATLRAILSRGMAPAPDDRWPSMEILSAQLERLIRPRGRRLVLPLGLMLTTGTVLGATTTTYWTDARSRCAGAREQLTGVWDEDRRAALRGALLATKRSYATQTWRRVESQLDEYAEQWAASHQRACEATRVTQAQGEATMDLRMDCLAERRIALNAVVNTLTQVEAEAHTEPEAAALILRKAPTVVAGLPGLERCDAPDELRRRREQLPVPEDPAVAERVDALRQQIAQMEAEQAAGQYASALAQVDGVRAEAEALGYWPLTAEVLLQHGMLLGEHGQYERAEQDLMAAHTLASEHDHLDVATRAAWKLADFVGLKQTRHQEGLVWANVALPLAKRSRLTPERVASMNMMGSIFRSQGRLDQAEDWLRRAVDLGEASLVADHPLTTYAINGLGGTLYARGKSHEAEREYRRAMQRAIQTLGEEHPDVAAVLHNIGNILSSRGEYREAERTIRRAIAIQTHALGTEHPTLATMQVTLAGVLAELDEVSEAQQLYERALEIYTQALGPQHPNTAMVLNNMVPLHKQRGDYATARQLNERVLEIFEDTLGPEHPRVAVALRNLGYTLVAQGQCAEAMPGLERALGIMRHSFGAKHPDVGRTLNDLGSTAQCDERLVDAERYYRDAITILEPALGAAHSDVGMALAGLAAIALAQDKWADARRDAERAVSIFEASPEDAESLAEARFVLAQALWPEPDQRSRALELARLARKAGASAPELARWLAEHGSR
ncbi:MAG: serine/threonine-protein kinase [Myxococcota bacterium]